MHQEVGGTSTGVWGPKSTLPHRRPMESRRMCECDNDSRLTNAGGSQHLPVLEEKQRWRGWPDISAPLAVVRSPLKFSG